MNMLGLNTQKPYLLFLLVVALGLLSYSVQSMRFDLLYGKAARCFSEEVKKDSVVFGNYSIVNTNEANPLPPHHTMSVQVLIYGLILLAQTRKYCIIHELFFYDYINKSYYIFLDLIVEVIDPIVKTNSCII